jgi:hypothetical protein
MNPFQDKRCDFCYSDNPTRAYDAGSEVRLRSFDSETGNQVGPGQVFDRMWAACELCGDYIDRGDWTGLQELVIGLQKAEMPSFVDWVLLGSMMTALYTELSHKPIVRIK